jgi:metal-sulfur cluster biosynthetic enzyme
MEGVSTDKTPASNVVIPHFVVAAFGFLILSVLILLSTETFFGHYYQPRLFAITHVAALGWVTMIIFGALYQLIPVVFETALFSERLARINLWLFVTGIIGMTYAFLTGGFDGILAWASILTFIALILFSINVLMSVRNSTKRNYSAKFIKTSIFWLFLTALIGLALAGNHMHTFLDPTSFKFLKIHAHFGIAGWFLQLIMGVASVLIPMFLVSHALDEKKLKIAYNFVNAGLTLLAIEWFLESDGSFRPVFVGIMVIGVLAFLSYLRDAYKKKLRKLDIGMKLTTVALVAIAIPIILGLIISLSRYFGNSFSSNLSALYGFTIFFAFITPLILGQTYKTLPFIVWLSRYQKYVGKKKTPMPADLYSVRIAEIHMWTYIAAILILGVGLLMQSDLVTKTGAIFLIITALLYVVNVIKIVSHKTKVETLVSVTSSSENNLMELLKTVIDPEVEINIVDMGLIYELKQNGDNKVDIEMTLSTPNCPVGDTIVMNVIETIRSKHPECDVNVHLIFEPAWSPKLITEEGRKMLAEGHEWKDN